MYHKKAKSAGRRKRNERRKTKKSAIYRNVGNSGALTSTQRMMASQFRVTLVHDTYVQVPTTAVQGGSARYYLNSLHHLQQGGTNKVIPNLGNLSNMYSSARVMGAVVTAKFISIDTNPATCRIGITNQDPGSTFSNYFSIEGNPSCAKDELGPIGTPNLKLTVGANFQHLVGGKFVATDDAYITNQATDPLDLIYFWVEADNPLGSAFTVGKGPQVVIRFSLDVVFFGLQIQIN